MNYMRVRARQLPALLLTFALALELAPFSSTPLNADELPVGATLSVISSPVEVALDGTNTFNAASDGQLIQPGDVVRTGDGGMAVLTFFDGSESQLNADSQLQVEHAEYTPAPNIALLQSAGVTLNRVIPLPPGGNFETDTPSAIGLVRGTSYTVSVDQTAQDSQPPLTSVVLLTDRDGHVGHVQLLAPATQAMVDLTQAGDVGATAGAATVAAQASDQARMDMESAATDLTNADTAHQAAAHARAMARALADAVSGGSAGSAELAGSPRLVQSAQTTTQGQSADAPGQSVQAAVHAAQADGQNGQAIAAAVHAVNQASAPASTASKSASTGGQSSAGSGAGVSTKTASPPTTNTTTTTTTTTTPHTTTPAATNGNSNKRDG